jgi:hypothetical protein
MKPKALIIIKILVTIGSLGLSLANSYIGKKELDNAVAEKVAEALAKSTVKES